MKSVREFLKVAVYCSVLLAAGCATPPPRSVDHRADASSEIIPAVKEEGYYAAPNSFFRGDGRLETIYTNEKKELIGLGEDGSRTVLSPPSESVAGRYPVFYRDGSRVYVLFWEKTKSGIKHLFFARSQDGGKNFEQAKPIASGGVLGRYSLAADGQGRILVAYMDESQPRGYRIYSVASSDYGDHWTTDPIRHDGRQLPGENFEIQFALEPQVAWRNGEGIIIWKEQGLDKEKKLRATRILSSLSKDGGKSWSAPYVVSRQQPVSHERLVLMPDGYYYFGTVQDVGLVAYKSADGMNWTSLGQLSGGYSVASEIEASADNAGIDVIFTGKTVEDNRRLFTARLTSEGWSGATRPIFDPEKYTNSKTPTLVRLTDGSLVLAWQDTATVLPTIMLSRKAAGGEWSAPVALNEAGWTSTRYPHLVADGKRLVLAYQVITNHFDMTGSYRSLELDAGQPNLGLSAPKFQDASAKGRLLDRVKGYWSARQEGNPAYRSYFDPIYQAKTAGPRALQEDRLKIKFHDYSIEDEHTRIEGNVAHVVVTYEFSVDQAVVNNNPVNLDHKPDRLRQTWVWVNGDWFLRVEPAMGSPLLQF